jgi:hypothetical protein
MSDKFAEGLRTRLAAYSQEVPSISTPQDKGTAQLAPLRTRLQKLLDTIPTNEQCRGLSLLDIQTCLRGRKGRKPHIGELAEAMRRLGWQRRRQWSNESASFSAKWHPADPIQSRSDD